MSRSLKAGTGTGSADARSLGSIVPERMLALVAAQIADPRERGSHALALGLLIGGGVALAAATPVLAVIKAGLLATVLLPAFAALLLSTAAFLAASGRLDVVLHAAAALFYGALAAGAGWSGGAASVLLPLLAIPPAEALVAGRPGLAAKTAAAGALVLAAAAGAEAFAGGAGSHPALVALAGSTGLGYVGSLLWRLAKGRTGAGATAGGEARENGDAASPAGLATLRMTPDGTIASASPEACALLALAPGEAGGAALLDRLHLADRVAYLTALDAVRGGRDVAGAQVRVRSGEAVESYRPLVLDLRPTREGVAAVLREAGAEPERFDALAAALEAANQSSAAKTQFLAAVSHELRTPLNAIIGFSDILDQEFFGGFETPRQKEYVGLIRQSGEHLLSVVNSLLDVSKIEAGRYELFPESFLLAEAMEAASLTVRGEAERKGLRLDVRPGCGGRVIVADRRACHQMLLNLLSNAVKFTDAGVVTLESRIEAETIVLSVGDTGIGIAPAELEKLGRPFTQVSTGLARKYQGTGLGLSLVKGLAELHHGSLSIRSEPQVGTEVTVRIPADCAARIEQSRNRNENIVALNDVRTKNLHDSPLHQTRRTA